MMSARESALWFYSERRIFSVPVPPEKKGSVTPHWNELRISDPQDFQRYFNGGRQNLGILTGPDNLTDVDIDSIEAVYAWKEYGLPTGMKWGHGDVTPTHFLYFADEMPATMKYLDPATDDPGEACLVELRCTDKHGKSLQTIAPPSIHPSGEPIEFVGGAGFPGKVTKADLEERVRLTAVAAMLGRHARDGACHQIFIALAGALARAEWPLEKAQRLVRAIFRVKWREVAELGAAQKEVESTYQHFDDGGDTTGLRTLAGLLDERVFRRATQLLGLERQEDWTRQQPAPQKPPRVLPKAYSFDSLKDLVIPGSEMLIDQLLVTPGLTLMVGASKSGKTILSLQMAMCLANRLHLFDYYSTAQANGLIVEWDDRRGKASLKDFEAKARASRPGQPLHWSVKEEADEDSLIDFTLSDPEFIPWLKGMIEEQRSRVVILDSYTALRGFHTAGKDIVKVEATELSQLNRLAIEMNCAFVLIHHVSKGASTQERHSRGAGTFAMQAVSEAQIMVERFRDLGEEDPARLVSVRGRHLRGVQMVLAFREATLDFDLVLDGPASEEFPRLRQLLRGGFRGKAFSAAEVQKELGWAKTQVYGLMSRLLASGLLRKDGTSWSWEPNWIKTLEQI